MGGVVRGDELYVEDLEFGSFRKLGDFGRIAPVRYRGFNLAIQTPKMLIPFGVSNFDGKYSLDVSFDGMTHTADCKLSNFLTRMQKFDALVQELAKKNNWLKNKQHIYCKQVKHVLTEDGEINNNYAPKIRAKIPIYGGEVKCMLFDHAGKVIDLNPRDIEQQITKGSDIRLILQCTGVWIAGSKYGVSWKVKQAQIFKRAINTFKQFAFADDSSD